MIRLTDGPTLWRSLHVRNLAEVELFRIPFTSVWCVWQLRQESYLVDETTRERVTGHELVIRALAALGRSKK